MLPGRRRKYQNLGSPWLASTSSFKPMTPKPVNCNLTWVTELMIVETKSWNSALILSIFHPSDAVNILQAPISSTGQKDLLVWNFTGNGRYSVHSDYKRLVVQRISHSPLPGSSSGQATAKKMWKRLWNLNIKGKVKHFLWRAFHKILPTCCRLMWKGVQLDETYKSVVLPPKP